MSRPLRVALCTAAVGAGHTAAAQAIQQAILNLAPATHVDFIEAMDLAPNWFTKVYRDGYLRAISKTPSLARVLYESTDKFVQRRGPSHMVENAAMKRLASHEAIRRADVVVTTHFLCARVLSCAKIAGRLQSPLCVCVTDQHPHGVWLVPRAELTLVASDAAREAALKAGMAGERVRVSGIPISPRFASVPDRQGVLREHGLPSDRPIVIVSGGGLGLGGMEESLVSLLESGCEVHALAICGKNERLRANLAPRSRGPEAGRASCTVIGFTKAMPELTSAASVLIGKPGGLSTAEACARGLPMVLLRPIPGQEERNASQLVSQGAAILEPDAKQAGRVAAELATDDCRLRPMREAALKLGRADAASEAARLSLELARTSRAGRDATRSTPARREPAMSA